MTKQEGKKPDKPTAEKARVKKPKKGFFASLFEPVAQDPDADFFFDELLDEMDTSESEALLHGLLEEDAEEDNVRHDSETVERITFEEGAPVVTDIPYDGGDYTREFSAGAQAEEQAVEDAYSILYNSFTADEPADAPEAEGAPVGPEDARSIQDALDEALSDAPDTIELTAESVVVEEPPEAAFTPPAFLYNTPTPDACAENPPGYVPLTSSIDAAAQTPTGSDVPASTETASVPAETAPDDMPLTPPAGQGMSMAPYIPPAADPSAAEPAGYVPLASSIDAGTSMAPYTPPAPDTPAGESNGYVPLTSSIDANTTLAPYAPTGMAQAAPKENALSGAQQAEWFQYASGAFASNARPAEQDDAQSPIHLFDEDDGLSDTARQRGQTTRLFRTGTSATTRIHINETEETIRREEAARRAEAREAKRRQDAAMERRNKKKKRSTILRSLFANVAFVLFFIAVVVVALYYGFLLSDIVVMGNQQYTSDYIIEESGLKPGTHMLFCNLDEAEANIAENPYIQVESVTYIFPNRVRIIVSERKEIAGIAGLDYNVIIDDQGYVLSMSPSTDLSGLLQVSGVSMTGFRLGQRLGEGNDFSTATLIEIIGKLEQYELIDDITAVDLTTPLAITMKADNGLTIHVGQGTDLDAKMSMLSRLLPRFTEQSIGVGTLYLSAKGGAVYSPPYAATNARPITTDDAGVVSPLPVDDPNYVDDDGDGLDDVTGLPAGQSAVPLPGSTPAPTPAPTSYVPGGGADDFSG